jgi:hypothetical protein
MQILFDHGVPDNLTHSLSSRHNVTKARHRGWERLKNGNLLREAEAAGFDVLVTTDKSMSYQQNLTGRKLALVVLERNDWGFIKPVVTEIVAAVDAATPGSFAEVNIPLPPKRRAAPP